MLFKLHIFATLFMTGLIWFVQVVHYPAFIKYQGANFPDFERFHQQRTTLVVLPVMIIELVTGVLLMLKAQTIDWYLTMGILVLIWLSTFFIQVPCHRKLEKGFDQRVWRRLVTSNWIRTVLWSLRAFIFVRLL